MTGDPRSASIRVADANDSPSCPAGGADRAAAQRELATLLTAVATGSRDAFTRFYRATSPRAFGLALRILRSHSAAEEVTQEVYLQVWSSAERYDASLASPIGWLMMITHRRAVDRVRTEESSTVRDRVFGHAHLGRDHDTVAESVGQRLDEQAVVTCLDSLTAVQREAIVLAYYSGRTYREVAEQLDAPLPTIKSRMRDALKRLQNCLSGVASHA
ncbi:ECF RNA polymerase sigma factor SigK [Nocardia spumae]|uniref:ECF RNA polymerase sigma factor SigK n=1 Tax=Nocardia spumae TaxID=2887190 RepID=UPI001D13973E|nr:ECF RNA polymerase sigma factor SigK [Nocardia spumae]